MDIVSVKKLLSCSLVIIPLVTGCATKQLKLEQANPFNEYIQKQKRQAQLANPEAQREFEAIQHKGIDALESFLQKYPTGPSSLLARQSIENINLRQIQRKGVGDRFRIAEVQPDHTFSCVHASFTIISGRDFGVNTDDWLLEAEYPKDRIYAQLRVEAGDTYPWVKSKEYLWLSPVFVFPLLCKESVLRFKGNILFNGINFQGQPDNPLAFVLLKSAGLVYVTGTGKVVLKDGTIVTLQDKRRIPKLTVDVDLGKFIAIGIVEKSLIYGKGHPRHYEILNESNKIICHASPSENAAQVDLSKFLGQKVGLVGTIAPDPTVYTSSTDIKPLVQFTDIHPLVIFTEVIPLE